MEPIVWAFLLGLGAYSLKARDERRRITLLGSQLRHYQIEKLMEQLIQGYQRALDEAEPGRRSLIWANLEGAEQQLAAQFSRFSADVGRLPAEQTRVCRVPLPLADRWWPQSTADLRALLDVHARGLRAVADNADQQPPAARARMLMAEMLLMQHTCHWFCKSRTVASARLLARHQSSHEQVLQAVSAQTRQGYQRALRVVA